MEKKGFHAVQKWVQDVASEVRPASIHFCTGTQEEYEALCQKMCRTKTLIPLNSDLHPNSFLARSDPRDVARTEESTFICSERKEEAGPTNHWIEPGIMREKLQGLLAGCMRGRTLYVIPFCMGPLGSPYSRLGVQITDSLYVVASMRLMTRMGDEVIPYFENASFVAALHTVGAPLQEGEEDTPWPCNIENRLIAHFPEAKEIVSYGSGYGGNALLGKKCFALRIASAMARDEGWLAEHMLIMGLTNPLGKKIYIAAAFPSSCGKTNLAMMTPTIPGWKVELIGDDIAWIHRDATGSLRAINPELGLFGVLPGTSFTTNSNAMKAMEKNTIFTNGALTDQGDVWWEGLSPPPQHLVDWKGVDWTPASKETAAHPNARFCASIAQSPILDPLWNSVQGVPISAILFGGRRSSLLPLVSEGYSWNHGVLMGAMMSSETTAAATGAVGALRHDPFAMLPFCGYHMGDYFSHWVEMGRGAGKNLPKFFSVNWFLKGEGGQFLWPGFGENSRVLKWIFERVEGHNGAVEKPNGIMPNIDTFDFSGLTLPDREKLFFVDPLSWLEEIKKAKSYFDRFSPKFPQELHQELRSFEDRLQQEIHG